MEMEVVGTENERSNSLAPATVVEDEDASMAVLQPVKQRHDERVGNPSEDLSEWSKQRVAVQQPETLLDESTTEPVAHLHFFQGE